MKASPQNSPPTANEPLEGHSFATPKTLFLILDSGTAIRNILRTDVYRVLRACRNLRLVIFSPLLDEDFKKEVGGDNVFFESLQKWRPGPFVKLLRSFRKDVWSDKYQLVRFRERRSSRRGQIGRAVAYRWLGGRSSADNRIDRTLERIEKWEAHWTPSLGDEFFEKYRPDLVFYSTIYSKNLCLELGAKQRGVRTCAYIVSWDNPTTKGPFPVRPDHAVVWNDINRDELLRFHGFRPDELCVSGPPQFDLYADRTQYLSREEFYRKWRLDPNKRLVTYTTGTVSLLPFEHEMVELLSDRIAGGALKDPSQLLVRLHPKDDFNLYRHLEGRPNLVFQLPGRRGKTDDSWNPTRSDMFELAETMAYSDVVVNIASTITIEAACFDTPIVNVAFDGFKKLPYKESCARIYDFDHYKKIVATGGAVIARDLDETLRCIQRYLNHPELEAEGRARIVAEQCHRFDGKAGERIGRYLIELLTRNDR